MEAPEYPEYVAWGATDVDEEEVGVSRCINQLYSAWPYDEPERCS